MRLPKKKNPPSAGSVYQRGRGLGLLGALLRLEGVGGGGRRVGCGHRNRTTVLDPSDEPLQLGFALVAGQETAGLVAVHLHVLEGDIDIGLGLEPVHPFAPLRENDLAIIGIDFGRCSDGVRLANIEEVDAGVKLVGTTSARASTLHQTMSREVADDFTSGEVHFLLDFSKGDAEFLDSLDGVNDFAFPLDFGLFFLFVQGGKFLQQFGVDRTLREDGDDLLLAGLLLGVEHFVLLVVDYATEWLEHTTNWIRCYSVCC